MMNINQAVQNMCRVIYVFPLFFILLLTGCGSIEIGRDFDVIAFENMAKVGKTTKAQVREVVGAPKSSGI